ncbi:MAG: bifunctional riboflavin kinase/FAD synthetase [Casimicrobiaceae bacterium]
MRIFRGLPAHASQPIALTIGNFDGVHRGHQAMLARLCEAADDLRLPPAVLTFDPHPREFFAPGSAPPRLLRWRQKLELFRALGVAQTYIARFDSHMAALSPAAFIEDVLVRRLQARWVLVGDDFRFGKARAGNIAVMRDHAASFSVEGMRTVTVGADRASSTAVREALAAGDFARAEALLGRPFAITGRVAHGEKLGRKLGFPTANIELPQRAPFSGIFAVRVRGLSGGPHTGVASLGVRPTIKADARPLLEVFVFDFDEYIYGRRVSVEFVHKLRDEEKYGDLAMLTRQIETDVAQAREFFATARA